MACGLFTKPYFNYEVKLTNYRVWRNWSKIELAKMLGISTKQLSDMEQGYKYPKYPLRMKIAEVFGLSENQIFINKNKEEV